MKTALVTGITGQDGTYLAEHLLRLGYDVFGLIRGQNNPKRPYVEKLLPDVQLIEGDLLDQCSLIRAVESSYPDEVYNLGAISFVPYSWDQAEVVSEVTGMGVLRMLEAIRIVGKDRIKFYQASSSEQWGKVAEVPQTEKTPFHPRSPYGVAKTFGHYITVNYRESHGMFACSGILANHESPRRGYEFVTRKISSAVARISLGKQNELLLGNLSARRDWGHAKDYVAAMHLILQATEPDDYAVGTGNLHSVEDFCRVAFSHVGLNWQDYVKVDPRFIRPAEVDILLVNPAKIKQKTGWEPLVPFNKLVAEMVENDIRI